MLLAVAAVAVVAVTATVWVSREPAVEPVAQDEVGPVLLVPGYGGDTGSLAELAAALESQGRDATVVALAGDGRGDLHLQAEVLDEAVGAALERTGARSVDVVGYSAGGVVARLWVKEYGGGSVARRVLTLGSPHHGAELAGLATDVAPDRCPTACLQLAPESDFLRQLNAGDETPAGPVWISVWSTDDTVVTPPSSASLDGALNLAVQSICPETAELSHGELPNDPFVVATAVRELGLAAPRAPSAAECAA